MDDRNITELEHRVTKLETTYPYLQDMLERNTASNEKLSETMADVQITLVKMNSKMDIQSEALEAMKSDMNTINTKIETIEEKGKFDIGDYLKKNFPWIVIVLGLGIAYASQYFKF